MSSLSAPLPIQAQFSALTAALAQHAQVILQAPPGAGKSTWLPLALVRERAVTGRIILLEPRRIAARNIARFLAAQLGEEVGATIGLRMRGESRVSARTRLEIVTEGVLTRCLQQDPLLEGIELIIFDEFHERSLHADTALAFALEAQALRDDLKILVMSATLEGVALNQLMPEAPVISSAGRAYPLEHVYRPISWQQPLAAQVGAVVLEALTAHRGSALVFLPGVRDIERVREFLAPRVASDVHLAPLHGRLPATEQQRAIAPAPSGVRKVVLTTNVAQTSLTIEGVHLVIDSGLERRTQFDSKSGLARLETRPISQASALQRAGRAGRLGPGVCYRLWSQEQQARLAEQTPPALLREELTDLVLNAALWGSRIGALPLLDTPPAGALASAERLLVRLGAMTTHGHLTPRGRAMGELGAPARVAAMLLGAQALEAQGLRGISQEAAYVAAWLEDDVRGAERLSSHLLSQLPALAARAKRWLARLGQTSATALPITGQWLGLLCALAWPDRIAQLRSGARYQLSGGVSADLNRDHPCQGQPLLVAVEVTQTQAAPTIYLAEPVALEAIARYLPELLGERRWLDWDEQAGRVRAECQQVLGEIVLSRQPLTALDEEQKARCLLAGVRRQGISALTFSAASSQLCARLACAGEWLAEAAWPAVSPEALLAEAEAWLLPALHGLSRLDQVKKIDLYPLLLARLDWAQKTRLDTALPTHFVVPTGSRIAIRYQAGQAPAIPVRMQEMFGQAQTPTVAEGRVALVVELLSPAQRPLQITADLAAFWAGSYRAVQKEMKGRYPRHYWPDNPLDAQPTKVTKKRMGL
ncbi:MAG: ATP-dependent helicase HrpB [Aeromonas sp.]